MVTLQAAAERHAKKEKAAANRAAANVAKLAAMEGKKKDKEDMAVAKKAAKKARGDNHK